MPVKISKQQKKSRNRQRAPTKSQSSNQKKRSSPAQSNKSTSNGHPQAEAQAQPPPEQSTIAEEQPPSDTTTQTHTQTPVVEANGSTSPPPPVDDDNDDAGKTNGVADSSKNGSHTEASLAKPKTEQERQQTTIDMLQRRRLQSCYLAEELMSKHNFDAARVYFEQSLNRTIARNRNRTEATSPQTDDSKQQEAHTPSEIEKEKEDDDTKQQQQQQQLLVLPELPNELDIYCKLLICRLHCDNSPANLGKALRECSYILSRVPNSVQHYIIQAELNIRCSRFDAVGACLLKAAEMDQPDIVDSVHLYFHQLAQNTALKQEDDDQDCLALPAWNDELRRRSRSDLEGLCHFFDDLTLISQQNVLSLEWEQIIAALRGPACDDIIAPLFGSHAGSHSQQEAFKSFLVSTLQWNLPQTDKQQSLIFLKVEFAHVLAKSLWHGVQLPTPPPDAATTKTMEDAIPADCKPTYFLENGLFGCRDGYDFVSAAIFEPSLCLSSMFDVVGHTRKLIVSHAWLYPSGIRLLHWLASTPLHHVADVRDASSEGAQCSAQEWQAFMQTRVNAHYAIDPELNETVLSRDAHEDGKKFEAAMEQIVGREKKRRLMQLELDLSIPILKKYAHIMCQISGIDEDVLIYELTLPDDDDDDGGDGGDGDKKSEPTLTSSLLQAYLNDAKFKDYKPVGLPVLVQNAEFDIEPTTASSSYDRAEILRELSSLEKEVVQFQIDYKNQVYAVAGDQATELDQVMATLQYRGLELTKWLRNFVKYMIARRDIEQEIVDVSKKATHKEAMQWFESMTNYLNGANNVLLKVVCKLFVTQLFDSYALYGNTNDASSAATTTKYAKYEIYPSKKIEKVESRLYELDCMVKFYVALKKRFESAMMADKFESVAEVQAFVRDRLLHEAPDVASIKDALLRNLKMSALKIPILEIAIPATIIENQYSSAHKNWMRYPLTQTYVDKTKLFLERCRYLRDTIVCIVYSSVEKRCLLLPTLHHSPNKYFKCIGCQKVWANLLCKNCNLAHYCGLQCQRLHWDKQHKRECKQYANLSSPTQTVVFK